MRSSAPHSFEMPTELEDLLDFLHHGNTQIRQIAVETLVPYSRTRPLLFKFGQLAPVKDLKLLIKDYAPIAKHALIILINVSADAEILKSLAEDNDFLESLLLRISNQKEPNADDIAILLANMAKSDSIERILTLHRTSVSQDLSSSTLILDQLLDLFVKGVDGRYNKAANYDYLAYLFADLAKFPAIQTYLLNPTPNDPLPPLTKLLPFTSYPSQPRRLGTVSALKNIALSSANHTLLLSPPLSILLPLLLPLAGPNPDYTLEETESLPDELQFLEPDKKRESSVEILGIILDTLYLLAARSGRVVKEGGSYLIVRELHLQVEDEGVRERCERLVQVIMGDEIPGEEVGMRDQSKEVRAGWGEGGRMITEMEKEDEDDKITEIF